MSQTLEFDVNTRYVNIAILARPCSNSSNQHFTLRLNAIEKGCFEPAQ